tara:strand:+ start:2182 stop:4512 length:2331 start_codon:yes stop_codon:yes gene_type:complete
MNKFLTKIFKKFSLICLLCCICSNTFSNEFEIKAEKVNYKNTKGKIIAEGNASAQSQDGKKIFASKIIYLKNKGIIQTFGNSRFIDDKKKLTADRFVYNINTKVISAIGNVIFIDQDKNKFFFNKFVYNEIEEIGSGDKIIAKTSDGSYLQSERGKLDNKNRIVKLDNGEFTSCSKIKNNKGEFCPSWSLKSKKIIHDKRKKIVTHKHAFFKLKKLPILYTPYISHPDPSVERKSGFLPPVIKTIENLGRTIKTPYFINISKDKDMTITPIYYFDENHIFNASYRQAFKYGFLNIETSYTDGYKRLDQQGRTEGSRNYFFTDFVGKKNNIFFKNNDINFKIQRVSQENYLKVNKLNTKLFKEDIRTLENIIRIQSYDENKRLDLKTGIYENLDIADSSKYTYFLPDGIFSINTRKNNLYNLNFNSYFQGKKFEKKQKQLKIKNNFSLSGQQHIFSNTGIGSSLKLSLFNKNIYNDKVTGLEDDLNINNNFTIASDNKLPLVKITKNSYQSITPRLFLKYTTGKMQNARSQDKILDYSDIFAINRTNDTDAIETGGSAGYGFDYMISKNKPNSIEKLYSSKFSFGQVIRNNREDALPIKSSLNNKTSDFVGNFDFNIFGKKIEKYQNNNDSGLTFLNNFNQNMMGINYKYNLNNDFSNTFRNSLNFKGVYNGFSTNIVFDEKNKHIGNEKYGTLELGKVFSKNYYFKFQNKRNLMTDSTEYNRFSFNFENDCLISSLTYSKDFYSDKDLKNTKTLIFGITIKPFADSLGPDLTEFIN